MKVISTRASASSIASSPRRSRRKASPRSPTDGKFDPHTQEALLSQPSDAEEGDVIQVLQKGYRLGDRVLRPARVVISAGTDG